MPRLVARFSCLYTHTFTSVCVLISFCWLGCVMQCHGEMYAVGSFINDVRNIPHELSLLTFTVKQINGRFKFLDVVKTVQGMVSKQRRGVVEYLVEEWRFLPQQVAVHSDGDGAGVMCIGGGSCSDSESLMDWE